MSYSIKNSMNLTMMKKSNNLKKSLNNSLINHTDSPKSLKTESSKEDYYIQISPRLETKMLTFTNQIKKLKVIQHEEGEINQSVKSQSQPSKEKIRNIVQKLRQEQPKSHFYNEMKVSRRLKTEQ
ncbi:unnamed protein product (macronuclear) [Paramecium tetraurelia]|uniref:Uncharacterized protein n=1 Tax=Paramecium tetraurelia TaxID=5888 RepID=A0CN89_PARTE|nr:uncharacterized protein GSPATT00008697001 [Paramecium tetraurelia]CAK72256.1 unnamed protein product [Paramecium tetraurelia]|eukprot:XP_001439653.1 hypothetical protein (macronuclear) [Paramecium tetraurelia strain d4-2]